MTPLATLVFTLLLPLLAAPFAAQEAAAPVPAFSAAPLTIPGPDGSRVPVVTTCGSRDKDYIVEVNGGGVVLGDFDADGHHDLVVVSGSTLDRVDSGEPGDPPRFLRNAGDGTFTEPGGDWAMAGGRWGMGGTAGDVDADGYLDLVVTEWGPNRVFENADGAGFVERTEASGLSGGAWSTSAALFDLELDGHLDLVVVNYLAFRRDEINSRTDGTCKWKGHPVMCGPEGLIGLHDKLYRGAGDFTFTDVSLEVGFRPERAGFGLGVTTLDHDGDGDTDLYVTNDSTPNHLWRNDGGQLVEVGLLAGVALDLNGKEQAGMGIAVGDLDGDGVQDLFCTNFSGEGNAYYRSRKRRGDAPQQFSEKSDRAGLMGPSITALGWGTAAGDYDLDGDLDLFVLNGHVYPQADEPGTDTSYAQEADLYRNDGEGRFAREPLSDLGPRVLRAGATADLDGDGDLDLVGIELDGAVQVFTNRAEGGAWLRVRPVLAGGAPAVGATVAVSAEGFERAAEVRTAGGFQASLPPEAHFGLGLRETVTVRVRFPSGREVERTGVAAGQVLRVDEPEAAADGESGG